MYLYRYLYFMIFSFLSHTSVNIMPMKFMYTYIFICIWNVWLSLLLMLFLLLLAAIKVNIFFWHIERYFFVPRVHVWTYRYTNLSIHKYIMYNVAIHAYQSVIWWRKIEINKIIHNLQKAFYLSYHILFNMYAFVLTSFIWIHSWEVKQDFLKSA